MKKIIVAVLLGLFTFQSLSIALPKDFYFKRAKVKTTVKKKTKTTAKEKAKTAAKKKVKKKAKKRIGDLPVLFSHKQHTKKQGLKCKNCHNKKMFAKKKRNTTKFNMKQIWKGQYCGKCHKAKGKAFNAKKKCARCHVDPKAKKKLKVKKEVKAKKKSSK